jgi:Fe2+ or Zn2+ uptake regulation protein
MKTYMCTYCGGTFESDWSDEEADQEALAKFGVKNASTDPDMVLICDVCYQHELKREKADDLSFWHSPAGDSA